MAIHNRVRPFGFWHTGSTITSGEFEQLDDNGAYSISATGGTYAPVDLLTIGGTGVTISGPFNATDAKYISVDTTLQMEVGSVVQLFGNLLANSGAIVGITSGAFITIASGGTLTANAGSTVTLAGTTTISGALTCSNTIALSGVTTQTGKLVKSGVSAYTIERVNEISSVQPTVTLDHSYDVHYVHAPTTAGTTVYTIDSSTVPIPLIGERMSVHAYIVPAAQDVDIVREDGSVIATVGTGSGGVDLQFMFGRWRCVGSWGDTTLVTPY